MNERPEDIVQGTDAEMAKAEGSDDQSRLETLEKVHKDLEAELNEGAETPPA